MPNIESFPRRVLVALLPLAALASAGCASGRYPGPGHRPLVEFTAGWRPLAHVNRTHLERDLELDDPGGFDASFVFGDAVQALVLSGSAGYAPMEEEDTGRDVDCFWVDAGLGGRGGTGLPGEEWQFLWHATAGPSLLVMEFERGGHDTVGLGAFGRAAVGLCWRQQVGLELFGDLHGWVGADSDDAQAAWAASLGVNVFVLVLF
jgi:hypothetical protein